MTYQIHRFGNGIRLVHRETFSPVAHLGVLINTGSRDDPEELQGIAHFIEHMLFKGTRSRSASQVINRLENIGSDVNAFTTKEETCLYASFLKNHYSRVLELFADVLNASSFPVDEITKEKSVVIDEIGSYKDSPADWIHDSFEEMIFPGHPMGRNILGTRTHIRKFSQSILLDHFQKNYFKGDIVISSVGAIPFSQLVRKTANFFESRPVTSDIRLRLPLPEYVPRSGERRFSKHQAHVVLGSTAYGSSDSRRFPMALLTNILGGPAMNSRLSTALREKNGIAYNVESNYHSFSDGGLFEIYFGTSLGMIEKSLDIVTKELKKLTNKAMGKVQLYTAKEQLKGQVAIASESHQSEMLAIARQLLLLNRTENLAEILKRIDAITAIDLLEVANEVVNPVRMSRLLFKY